MKTLKFIFYAMILITMVLSACAPQPTVSETIKEVEVTRQVVVTEEIYITQPPPEQPTLEPTEEPFDWTRFAGTELNLIMVPHPYTEALKKQLPLFEQLTGIKVNLTTLPYYQAGDKIVADLSTGTAQFDVVFSAYPWDWQLGQYYAPLDEYINDPILTDQTTYDFADFNPLIISSNRWDGIPGHELGEGPIFSIPVMVETYILAYRKDLLEQYNVAVPNTWEEYFAAAKALRHTVDGRELYGVIGRGTIGIGAPMTNFINMYRAYGLTDFDENMVCRLNDPMGAQLMEEYVNMMQEAGPTGWPEVFWDDTMARFSSGDYAMVFDINFAAQNYENPETSQIVGKVGYALPFEGPEGRFSNIWAWGLALNKASKNADAGWYLIQWATGKDMLLDATLSHRNFNPTRLSVWDDPRVVNMMADWGDGTYREISEETLIKYASQRWTPEPQITQVGTIWMTHVHDIYFGNATAQEAMDAACSEINDLMQRIGIQE